MPLWGKTDAASNSAIAATMQVNKATTTTNRNNLFGNTTADAFITGIRVGQFAANSTEVGVTAGGVALATITHAGSGYGANGTVTFSGGGGSSAAANAAVTGGRVTTINITNAGSSYETNPNVAISAPAAITFNALSAVSNTDNTIALSTANSFFLAGDRLTYTVAAGNTAIGGLTSGTTYFVKAANSTTISLAATATGATIDLTAGVSETGHSLTGTTATATVVVGGGTNKGIAHTGWVLRTEGTGGRAGRVQYEVLVAMSEVTSDASDDAVLPDA